ncbi:MAG: ABC transporter permease [Bacilli bacterium]|nr:ABC transporter permease [Bacilli bacterium]MDD3305113.1 ABC transporter permease [Bacilli bacterium]MDD4053354.1 ABC transporter permease [Bacilli bacterium]MDD4410999.1 ABC transporter permease [Bacilli bacterium]
MSDEHKLYLKKRNRKKRLVLLTQIIIFITFIAAWEAASYYSLINPFLTSSPSNIIKTIIELYNEGTLFNHILITAYETFISFGLGTIIGILIASIMWWNNFFAKVLNPYLTVLNSLPKVALGPILIIWAGANMSSIIIMALLISVIITIITVYHGFSSTDENKIKLLKSFNVTKLQLFIYLILPGNMNNIFNALKINISMSLIGVIMGELLVSKEGIGYLIMYGSQVFNLNLVMTGIVLLCIISFIMYYIIIIIEKKLIKYN